MLKVYLPTYARVLYHREVLKHRIQQLRLSLGAKAREQVQPGRWRLSTA